MSRQLVLVLTLAMALAFTLGLLFRPSEGLPDAAYRLQAQLARATAQSLARTPPQEQPYVAVADLLRPSVVSIWGSEGARRTSTGTGVIVDERGFILTNLHVIEGLDTLIVTLSSHERYRAEVVGADGPTDLCVLRIRCRERLLPARFALDGEPRVGQEVLAMGNALGFGWTVSQGIVSSLHRSSLKLEDDENGKRYRDFIQTDAAVHPGNSGGPLVDLRGGVIGINALIVNGQRPGRAMGFAIPARDAAFVARELMTKGRVERGFLGVEGFDVRELSRAQRRRYQIPYLHGVLVSLVTPRSPAWAAGMRKGDVILTCAERPVADYHELRARVACTPVGTEVSFEILRDGEKQRLEAVLSRKPLS